MYNVQHTTTIRKQSMEFINNKKVDIVGAAIPLTILVAVVFAATFTSAFIEKTSPTASSSQTTMQASKSYRQKKIGEFS